MAVEAKYTIRAEDKSREGVASAERNLGNFQARMEAAATKLAGIGESMVGIGKKMTVGLTAPLVVLGVSMVKSADEQAKAIAALSASVIAVGNESVVAIDRLIAHASEMQGKTLFGDEVQIRAMSILESLTKLDTEGLLKVMPHVLDLATAFEMDLQTAAELVGKTLGSSTNALSRYGIEVSTGAELTDKLAQLTDVLGQKFGGAAEAAAAAGMGPLTIFRNRLSDIGEQFGDVIIPHIVKLLDKLSGMLTWLENLSPAMREFLVTFAAIAAVAGPGLVFLGSIARAAPAIVAAVSAVSGAFAGLATALGGLVTGGGAVATAGLVGGPFGLAIAGFAALSGKAAALAHDIAYWIIDTAAPKLRQFCTNVAEWFVNLATSIADAISKIARAIADWVGDKLASARDKVGEWVEGIKGKFEWLWDKLVGHSIIPDMVTEILDWMDVLVKGMDEKSAAAAEKTAGNLSGMGRWAKDVGLVRSDEGGTMGGTAGLAASLAGLAARFTSMIAATETFTNFVAQLNLTLAPFLEGIAKPIVALLTPFVQILMRIVTALMPAFSAIFESLNRLLEATMPFWETLGGVVVAIGTIFSWLAQKVIALGEVIYYAVTGQWAKIKTVDWGGNLFDMLKESTANYQNAGGDLASLPAAATGGAGSYGGGASYTTPRIINIAAGGSLITVNTEVITGDGGIDELVLMLRDRLRRVEALGY